MHGMREAQKFFPTKLGKINDLKGKINDFKGKINKILGKKFKRII